MMHRSASTRMPTPSLPAAAAPGNPPWLTRCCLVCSNRGRMRLASSWWIRMFLWRTPFCRRPTIYRPTCARKRCAACALLRQTSPKCSRLICWRCRISVGPGTPWSRSGAASGMITGGRACRRLCWASSAWRILGIENTPITAWACCTWSLRPITLSGGTAPWLICRRWIAWAPSH